MVRNSAVSVMAAVLGLLTTQSAWSQACPCAGGTRVTDAALVSLLSNRMACAVLGNERWQEWHNGTTSGPLVDYKKGPGHSTDPSETVGTYSIVGSGATNPNASRVRYTYTGDTSYEYAVCQEGGAVHFCGAEYGGRNITNAAVSGSGLSPCPGSDPVAARAAVARRR